MNLNFTSLFPFLFLDLVIYTVCFIFAILNTPTKYQSIGKGSPGKLITPGKGLPETYPRQQEKNVVIGTQNDHGLG